MVGKTVERDGGGSEDGMTVATTTGVTGMKPAWTGIATENEGLADKLVEIGVTKDEVDILPTLL